MDLLRLTFCGRSFCLFWLNSFVMPIASSLNSTSSFNTFRHYLPSPVVLLLPVALFLGEAVFESAFAFGPSLSG